MTRRAWSDADPQPATPAPALLRWEFYVGGMVGLTLGFVLRTASLSGRELIDEAIISCGYAIVWFGAFAALDAVPWTGPSRCFACVAGVLALLLNLCVSGGISFPSVAQPLWVMAALALASLPATEASRASRSAVANVVPLPLLAAAFLTYLISAYIPVTSCARELQVAQLARQAFRERRLEAENKDSAPSARNKANNEANALLRYVTRHLGDAAKADPGDAMPHLESASWYRELWERSPPSPDDPPTGARKLPTAAEKATGGQVIAAADHAAQLDPLDVAAFRSKFDTRLRFAVRFAVDRDQQFDYARLALQEIVARDPTEEGRLRFRLAEALFEAGEVDNGLKETAAALRCDREAPSEIYRLTERQRHQLARWLVEQPSAKK
jgi:hypothetical protein